MTPSLPADGVVVLTVVGEVDVATIGLLSEHLDRHLVAGRRGLVLDLDGVSFFPAGGLRLLDQAVARAADHTVTLALTTDSRAVLRVMDLTGWTGTISRLPSIAAAVEHCLASQALKSHITDSVAVTVAVIHGLAIREDESLLDAEPSSLEPLTDASPDNHAPDSSEPWRRQT